VLASPLTATGALLGTPAFMSPEQFHGARIDAASDQFSFCAALFAALYGQRPFAGDGLAELMLNVTSGALGRPPANTGVPVRLLAILQRGLARDPQARWPTMDALLAQLAVDPQRDASSAPRERRRIALFMFPTVAVIAISIRIRQGDPATQVLDPADSVLPILLAFLMIVVATLAFRRRLWPHLFHRNVMVCSLLILGHSLALRLALVHAGLSYDAITQVDMLVHPFVCIAAGWFIARWFYLVAAVPVIGGLVSLFVPAWTNAMAAILFPAQGLILIYLWTRDAARQRSS
jgi:serine/threonine-protein kinase